MPYIRWTRSTTPAIIPQSWPDQYTCIDQLAILDPKGLTIQNGPTQAITTWFLDHCGVLEKTSLPLLIPPAQVLSTSAKTPRVPMFKYPIPPHSLAAWKTRVAVDSHSPTSLAIVTANAILRCLKDGTHIATPANTTGQQLGDMDSILSLATDLQNIRGDAMDMATTMFPLETTTPCKGQFPLSPMAHSHSHPKPSTISTLSVTAPTPSVDSPH
jgi:hypothetical protein